MTERGWQRRTPAPLTTGEEGHERRGPPILEVRGVTKTFPGVIANEDVDLTLHEGQVLCLLGENGAGKSTLMNTVFGLYQPDAGEILLRGEPVQFDSSRDAIAAGIGMVHQHFQLIPVFTVVENVMLGDELRKGRCLDLDGARARIRELGARSTASRSTPTRSVGDLSVGEQQRVELIKALYRRGRHPDPRRAHRRPHPRRGRRVLRRRPDAWSTRASRSSSSPTSSARCWPSPTSIVVLRGGKVVGDGRPEERHPAEPGHPDGRARRVLHHRQGAGHARASRCSTSASSCVDDDRGVTTVADLDLEVRAGEMFGIAGVEGNGQRELVEALMGMRPKRSGGVVIAGRDVTHASPREIIELGVGHVPEDRSKHGLVGPFTIADNLVLNRYRRAPFARRGLRDDDAIERHADDARASEFDVRTPEPERRRSRPCRAATSRR